ncbi:tryptophan halogenase family protein [Microbulbifer agarilyticus]|uniref:tryptophan halogenase family protein n=1 Tax=Microbulbifer agarilyticus TaxID=260552 RepID=UPI001CD1B50B|nr:tryptophan halogenase family protein [Microbulbifer agarilyticus]MCA0893927.1 tryptophan 7-halogenase [Microbulbifer agarilyticus]
MNKNKLIVVGGGTAGWMAALMLQKAVGDSWSIELIESSKRGIIGVGEGSTPALKSFFEDLAIPEDDWMPACSATYKSGITFDRWSEKPGFTSYFHPFYSHFDRDHAKALIHNSHLRRSGRDVHAHPDVFSYNHYLAKNRLSPVTPHHFPFEVQYGYHFDAGLLAQYLKKIALMRGVHHRDTLITDVDLSTSGDIAAVIDEQGERHEGEWFVDCSGFAALLIGDTLKTPFTSYADTLWNDSAVTLAMPPDAEPPCETVSTALKNGWAWRIPLQSRVGYGYVYSSRYCTREEAEEELRAHAGADASVDVRHLSMNIGRREKHWVKNCVAVGLSQGFIEPLEATSLALTQQTITRFIHAFREGNTGEEFREIFNTSVNKSYDDVRDYISVHFLTNSRTDSQYWVDSRERPGPASKALSAVFSCWFDNGDLPGLLKHLKIDGAYSNFSWHYILCGMGVFPGPETLTSPSPKDLSGIDFEQIRDFFARCTLNHQSHIEALKFSGLKRLL